MTTKLLDGIDSPEDVKVLALDDLTPLAHEIRTTILRTTAANGGHLATNLGSVELSLALHYVLDSPRDKIMWDVGNQCYTHKLVTGRRARFDTLRKAGGISGFVHRGESPHDHMTAGHSSTALSAAVGIAAARDHLSRDERIVAVVGDGAMSAGLFYEALNNLSTIQSQFLLVLNDNDYAIGASRGGFAQSLRVAKSKILDGGIFDKLGVQYLGPVDGHDLPTLIEILQEAVGIRRPVVLHVITKKGMGFAPAEADPERFHGVAPFDLETGEWSSRGLQSARTEVRGSSPALTYSNVFVDELLRMAEGDDRIVAITAAMCAGTGLDVFADRFPDRCFDVGIAEQHAVTFAAGLALGGCRPVLAIYSTFLQRGFDQVFHDVCLQGLPVTFILDRAGITGADGPTHHGVLDLGFLRALPGMVLMAPKDADELREMLAAAIDHEGPTAVRIPRGAVPERTSARTEVRGSNAAVEVEMGDPHLSPVTKGGFDPPVSPLAQGEFDPPVSPLAKGGFDPSVSPLAKGGLRGVGSPIEIGRGERLRDGDDAALLAIGSMVTRAVQAADRLEQRGVSTAVINARFIKPLDTALILETARGVRRIFTIEEHVRSGGFGSGVCELLSEHGVETPVTILALPDRFIEHGTPDDLLHECGLSTEKIVAAVIARRQASPRDGDFSPRGRPRGLKSAARESKRPSVSASEIGNRPPGVPSYPGGIRPPCVPPYPGGIRPPCVPPYQGGNEGGPYGPTSRTASPDSTAIGAAVTRIRDQRMPDELERWVARYSEVGQRDAFLWKWCLEGVRLTSLSSVDADLRDNVNTTKVLGVMLDVLLDDVADHGAESAFLERLLDIPFASQPPDFGPFSETQRRYAATTCRLWETILARSRPYPRFGEFENLLRFDYLQLLNTMRYSHMVNRDRSLLNLAEHDLYLPHNMHMMISGTMDLMCSSGFDRSELGIIRETLWQAQCMGRIGNLVTTWEREIEEGDFTSGVFARAVQQGALKPDALRPTNARAVHEAIRTHDCEGYFLDRWWIHRARIAEQADRVRSVDVASLIRGLEQLLTIHMGSRGLK